MLEELLPTQPLFGVGPQHPLNEGLAHFGYVVNGPRKLEVFLGDHSLELIDVLGVVGRAA